MTQAIFTPGAPFGTWTAGPGNSALSITEFPEFEGLSAGTSAVAIAQGTSHLGIVNGEFGGNIFGVIQLPSISGTGTPCGCLLAFLASAILPISARPQDASSTREAAPLARLDGESILEQQLQPQVRAQLEKLRRQEEELKRKALDALLVQKLAEAEAKRRGVTLAQYLDSEVDSKVSDPMPEELNAYYLAQRDQIHESFEAVKDQLRQTLKNVKVQQARQNYANEILDRAKQSGEVVILLRTPRTEVGFDAHRLKGSQSAPVMIVEFSDFGCPFCRKAQSSLNQVMSKYAGKVSLAYRDYPLTDIHPTAETAAEASRCAAEQGKFWEYHDLLFGNPEKQDRQGLLLNARTLQLDESRFSACLESGKYKASIEKDRQDGLRAGVIGTPGFFINGIFLDGAQPPEAFEKLIDQELAANQNSESVAP
jgi:protein-disulfide isomerase